MLDQISSIVQIWGQSNCGGPEATSELLPGITALAVLEDVPAPPDETHWTPSCRT
jgi:hypothetical protein